jgi:hypothetical protein
MALADNPPHIYGLEPEPEIIPSVFRGKDREEKNTQDINEVITWMVVISFVLLLVYKYMVARHSPENNPVTGRLSERLEDR